MRGRPKSRSRLESRRSLCALALVVLAPACGGSTPAAGFRPGTGGQGGNAGLSGGATGGGGSSPGAGGTLADAGSADALAPFDGGMCIDNASQQTDPNMTAAGGTFSGALAGAVCTGAAFAHVQSTPAVDGGAPTIELLIETLGGGDPAARVRFQDPSNATDGFLSVDIGLPAASPGTYTQDVSCGSTVLAADLPAPDPSVCATDAGDGDCPTGCEATGPIFAQVCTPIAPQLSYAALGASDCRGDVTTPAGSWTLTLKSLTADPAGPDSSGNLVYAAHGTLSATLADQSADAGTTGVSLTLSF